MGKRDFVDRVDSVDPVGEFIQVPSKGTTNLVHHLVLRSNQSSGFQSLCDAVF